MAKTVILDFYGTVVHEAHALLDRIAEVFRAGGARCGNAEIHALWWRYFSSACDAAHGAAFRPQKELYAPALCIGQGLGCSSPAMLYISNKIF